MRRSLLFVLILGLIVIAAGLAYLGAFPPAPHVEQVQKVLPNDRFKTH